MNTRIVHSQYMGGMIWGISSALHEATEIDARYARYVNDNLADYMIPVNADVKDVQVILVSEEDHDEHPAGVKGLGELANVGTAAAIANAVYHAIGKRIRQLPIRIESCCRPAERSFRSRSTFVTVRLALGGVIFAPDGGNVDARRRKYKPHVVHRLRDDLRNRQIAKPFAV